MKFKKLAFMGLSLAAIIGAASCKSSTDGKNVDPDSVAEYVPGTEVATPEGFTSLANTNSNGAIDSDGYYTVGSTKIKTKKEYKTVYTTEPTKDKFNYLTNQWTYNSEHYTNMLDGLVENDKYSNIVGAMATSYKTTNNEDGTQTWTFKIREGVKWVNNKTGEVVATVTANDWVAGLRYVLDPINGSGTAGIVTGLIKNSKEYYDGLATTADATDDISFDKVGVKATGTFELEFTLYEPTPYFLTSLTYSPFLPVNEKYLDEAGTEFGATENNILVNGAFRITERVTENKIVYSKNTHYWDLNHVYVDTITKRFVPGTATSADIRKWYESGEIDGFTVNSKDTEGYKKYVTGEDGTGTIQNPYSSECNGILSTGDATYVGYFNYVRSTYEYTKPEDAKTDAQKAATQKALLNVNFRKGFLYGFKVEEYLKMVNEFAPLQYLMRGYTIKELCAADGKDYVDYVTEVFNKKQGTTGVSLYGIENGSDPVYNATKATEFFNTAKTELKAAGLTDSDFPIRIDVIGDMDVETQAFEKTAYATIEAASSGLVKIVYNVPSTSDENSDWGSIHPNYDFSMYSGWGPDYADPNTFLHTFSIGGDMVYSLGFNQANDTEIALEKQVLGEYDALYRKAAAITDASKLVERYQAFAEAEYKLIYEDAIIIPWYTKTGYYATVSKTVPYQAGKATYGLTSDKLKNVIVSESVITKEIRAAVKANYDSNK